MRIFLRSKKCKEDAEARALYQWKTKLDEEDMLGIRFAFHLYPTNSPPSSFHFFLILLLPLSLTPAP